MTLAIRRGVWAKLGSGPNGNSFPYVYSNPDENTRVDKCDSLYVLSSHKSNKEVSDFVLNHFAKVVVNIASTANAFRKMHPQLLGKIPVNSTETQQHAQQSSEMRGEIERRLTQKIDDFQNEIREQIKNIVNILEQKSDEISANKIQKSYEESSGIVSPCILEVQLTTGGANSMSTSKVQEFSTGGINSISTSGVEEPPTLGPPPPAAGTNSETNSEGMGGLLAKAGAAAAHASNKGNARVRTSMSRQDQVSKKLI